jgi:hydroxymethylpyrimidine/phosphomethylpyrimidine kinase
MPGVMREDRGRVLIIAGSDSGGGAGLQADLKTVTVLGGYASTVVTAVTVQNTLGVSDVFPIPPEIVLAQGRAVLGDIGADALKLGMLGDGAVATAAAELVELAGDAPAVVDPVMSAKGGVALMAPDALAVLRERLLPRAALITPNAPEAALLTGLEVADEAGQRRAGEALLAMGAQAVLMKGGHVAGPRVVDILMTPMGETRFESGRVETRHTHGTGCTLASAIAAGLARGRSLEASVDRAHDFVQQAIRHAPGFGAGHGPLGHNWSLLEGE